MQSFGRRIPTRGWEKRAVASWRRTRFRRGQCLDVEAATQPPPTRRNRITNPPYLDQVVELLKSEDPDLWAWFSSPKLQQEQAEKVRLDLLKSTYRLNPVDEPEVYALAQRALEMLELDVPITLYQVQQHDGLNASLAFLPDEAHIVLHGNLRETLTDEELQSVLGHELGHLLLWEMEDRRYLYTDQLLSALSWDEGQSEPYQRTARLYALYTEVFCDRAAILVAQDLEIVVSALVKINTGSANIQVQSYLQQAEEVLSRSEEVTDGYTHPETYLRAHALQVWFNNDPQAEQKIAERIEGPIVFTELDLFGQRKMQSTTRNLVQHILQPDWIRTEAVLGHARLFFDDVNELLQVPALPPVEPFQDKRTREYLCYVLLDFVAADRDLDPAALAHAIQLANQWNLTGPFKEIAVRELRMRKKQFDLVAEGDEVKNEMP